MSKINEPTNCANCGAYVPNVRVLSASSTAFCCGDCKKAYYKNRPVRSCFNKLVACFLAGSVIVGIVQYNQDPGSAASVDSGVSGTGGSAETTRRGVATLPDHIDGNWTNREGKVITAILLRVEGSNAVLLKDGAEFSYPIGNLSDRDQLRVRAFSGSTE